MTLLAISKDTVLTLLGTVVVVSHVRVAAAAAPVILGGLAALLLVGLVAARRLSVLIAVA